MGVGTSLRDELGFGRYIRERILPLLPPEEPVPFRGRTEGGEEPLPFFEEMESCLEARPGAVFSVVGPSGFGKTFLGRWAAARWGRRFLEDPENSPVPLWVDAGRFYDLYLAGGRISAELFPGAVTASLPAPTAERLGELIAEHPFILIVDKDEDPRVEIKLVAAPGAGRLRCLHLALNDRLPGPWARLEPWDHETALLHSSHRRGEVGLRRLSACRQSPAADLLSYPLFVARLLEREEASLEELAGDGGVPRFLRELFGSQPAGARDFAAWCEALLVSSGRPSDLTGVARKLHLVPAGGEEPSYAAVFRSYLLAELFTRGKEARALASRELDRGEISFLARILAGWPGREKVLAARHAGMEETSNRINLHWALLRAPIPPKFLRGARAGLRLAGYRFEKGLSRLNLIDSDLREVTLGRPLVERSRFVKCDLREADLSSALIRDTCFRDCDLRLADLSETVFERCEMRGLDLSEAILTGTIFSGTVLENAIFGWAGEGEKVRFTECKLLSCSLSRLAPTGIFCERSSLEDVSFQGLHLRELYGEGTRFEKCDFIEVKAPAARLAGSRFLQSVLSAASLRGADLRKAVFREVDFQPGPGSRAGLTDERTRVHPLHGSQSGYYAQDLIEGVYGDPELLRTADLREADLRGAKLDRTDLFRVDLRGARMDPEFREEARRMQAFVE